MPFPGFAWNVSPTLCLLFLGSPLTPSRWPGFFCFFALYRSIIWVRVQTSASVCPADNMIQNCGKYYNKTLIRSDCEPYMECIGKNPPRWPAHCLSASEPVSKVIGSVHHPSCTASATYLSHNVGTLTLKNLSWHRADAAIFQLHGFRVPFTPY